MADIFQEAKERVRIKKELFQAVLGALISTEFVSIPTEEAVTIAEGAIKSFKERF